MDSYVHLWQLNTYGHRFTIHREMVGDASALAWARRHAEHLLLAYLAEHHLRARGPVRVEVRDDGLLFVENQAAVFAYVEAYGIPPERRVPLSDWARFKAWVTYLRGKLKARSG